MLTITIKNFFFEETKWFSISQYKGRGQSLEVLNCLSTKNTYFWEIKTPKIFIQNPHKHLLGLASDSQKKNCRLTSAYFFNRKISGSLPVPITVSELWEWLFLFNSHNSLRGRTPLPQMSECSEHNSVSLKRTWKSWSKMWSQTENANIRICK